MAEKRIFDIETEATIDDITEKVYAWLDKKAQQGEVQEPSWKFDVYLLVKILNNFATKFVPNVATVEGKCYWHNGVLYKCNVAYTGDWVPGNFTLTSVDELFARKDVLSALQEALETTNGNVTALTTYAQNVAASIAPEFDPTRDSEHAYPAGYSVTYTDGKTYTFTAPHYGAWTGSDVEESEDVTYKVGTLEGAVFVKVDLNDKALWLKGGYDSATGVYSNSYNERLCTKKMWLSDSSSAPVTFETGVTGSLYIYGWDKDGTYVGGTIQVNLESVDRTVGYYKSLYPSAVSFAYMLGSLSGSTVSVDNLDNICTFSGTVVGTKQSLTDEFIAEIPQLDTLSYPSIDLDDKSLWRFGGYDTTTGAYNDGYNNRLCTKSFLEIANIDGEVKLALKTGVSATVYMYAKDSNGTYLGQKSTKKISALLGDYPSAKYVSISLVNVSGTTVNVSNLDSIGSFAGSTIKTTATSNAEVLDNRLEYSADVYSVKRCSTPKLKVATRRSTFAFIFDDATERDADIVKLFKNKGVRCGFAFVAGVSRIEGSLSTKYLQWQADGFEILNHSLDAKAYNTTNYSTKADAFAAMNTAKVRMESVGFVVNGFVAPNSTMEETYKPIIGELNAFGFVEIANSSNKNTPSTPVTNLHRLSLQSSNSLQDIKDYVDAAITNSEMVVFYGHAAQLDNDGDFTLSKISDVIDYVLAKQTAGQGYVGTPTEAVRLYYSL